MIFPVRAFISCEQSSQVHGEKDGLVVGWGGVLGWGGVEQVTTVSNFNVSYIRVALS